MSLFLGLQKDLNRRQSAGNLRSLNAAAHFCIDFASNDYLGLSRSKLLRSLVLKEWDKLFVHGPLNGLGSTGSRLLTGNCSYAEELEQQIASYHGCEAGLLFSCGYMANVGLLSSLAKAEDHIYYDAHIHASTYEGIRLSRANSYAFRHNDVDHLEKRLKRGLKKGNCFVCIESIYSMDGSMAPLQDICALCKAYQAHLIVDEAHAVGVFASDGSGLIAEKKLKDQVFAQIITFGKALGTYGAIVLGKCILKKYMLNFARSCLYTTALPLHNLAAIKCAYDLLPDLVEERLRLHALIAYFQKAFKAGYATPIQVLSVKGNDQALELSCHLAKKGFDVRAMMSPTVRRGQERLRLCLHAFNTQAEVRELIDSFRSFEPMLS